MLEYQGPITHGDLPLYDRIGNLDLVGVSHTVIIEGTMNRGKVTSFRQKVRESSHLLLEATKKGIEISRDYGLEGYEYLAWKEFAHRRQSITHLEQDSNHLALAEQYGMRRDLFPLYQLIPSINVQELLNDISGNSLAFTIEILRQTIPGLSEIDNIESLVIEDQLPRILRVLDEEFFSYLTEAGQVLNWYIGRARDLEIICPRLEPYINDQDKKPVAIGGADHIRYVRQYHEDPESMQLPQWEEFLASLDPMKYHGVKGFFQHIEKAALPA
jgi:hypothetical protein